jgi:16S rRNA processing protein RimM
MNLPNLSEIGKIQRTHGVNGELQVSWLNDFYPEDHTLESVFLQIDGIPIPFFITSHRFKGAEASLIKLEEIDSINQADELVGLSIFADIKKNQSEIELFLDDLIGFTVISSTGIQLGVIEDLQDYSGNLIFQVKTPAGKELLIPASPDFIMEIGEESKSLVMEIPEGLTDL